MMLPARIWLEETDCDVIRILLEENSIPFTEGPSDVKNHTAFYVGWSDKKRAIELMESEIGRFRMENKPIIVTPEEIALMEAQKAIAAQVLAEKETAYRARKEAEKAAAESLKADKFWGEVPENKSLDKLSDELPETAPEFVAVEPEDKE